MSEIFVTVGTHEQPFNRLTSRIDELAVDGQIAGLPVFCQYGYSTHIPRVDGAKLLMSDDFKKHLDSASVVVSHGGPGSIMPIIRSGKPLVVVPRLHEHGEHVDDHQVAFCDRIASSYGVPVVHDISDLELAIKAALERSPRNASDSVGSPGASVARLSRLIAGALDA